MMMQPARVVNILGVGVSAINMAQALALIDEWITQGERRLVTVVNVFSIMESWRHADLRAINNHADLVTPDGVPLVWLSKLHGHKHVGRVYGPDLMLALCQQSLKAGHTHYLYGGSEETSARLAERLAAQFPDLRIVGRYAPPFRPLTPEEDAAVVEQINAAQPDILWVALGAPKQERWMASHRSQLNVPVMIGVGAAFDFHAGVKPQAPLWMQRSGLEWLFRLGTEPRRLWRRYLINNPLFMALVTLQLLGLRRYPVDG